MCIERQLPVTRYYGSKRKLIKKIWEVFNELHLQFESVLDVFGGSGVFSYSSKCCNKNVTYNDIFKFNYYIGKALLSNFSSPIDHDRILNLLNEREGIVYKNIIEEKYRDVYFLDEENHLIDVAVQNIDLEFDDEFEKASAFYVLFQTCLIKRPFNLFHRKNLSLRTNHITSNFGNKKTWEKSFHELFEQFITELREVQFNNEKINNITNTSALNCDIQADLVYIDPPYFNTKGSHISYHSRYHFLEGLTNYNELEDFISLEKNNKEIQINHSKEFEYRSNFCDELRQLLSKHVNSTIVISYRDNGYPSIEKIKKILSEFKREDNIHSINLGEYSYALNRSRIKANEYLIIGR
jgi:adenine-specific DNA-methyltransferase